MPREHTPYKCPPDCNKPYCQFCDGGLCYCVICGGGESSLPTECPGVKMSVSVEKAVQDGRMDFVNGNWIKIEKVKVQ